MTGRSCVHAGGAKSKARGSSSQGLLKTGLEQCSGRLERARSEGAGWYRPWMAISLDPITKLKS